MNYLGHIFLSGENAQLMIGNFIGDYVKGNQYLNYPEEVQKGILLHRAIDNYTDHNSHWIESKELLTPLYRRYAGVTTDIFYDHFLAAGWHNLHPVPLHRYVKYVHAEFLKHYHILPKRVQGFLPYLIQHKRLLSYAQPEGIEVSLKIMSMRTSLPNHSEEAMNLLKEHYPTFQQHFDAFISEISSFTEIEVAQSIQTFK